MGNRSTKNSSRNNAQKSNNSPPQLQGSNSPPQQQQRRSSPLIQKKEKVKPNNISVFNDDDEIVIVEGNIKQKQGVLNIKDELQIKIKTTQKVIKLDSKNSQMIPLMVTTKTRSNVHLESKEQSNIKQKKRPGIDLICVIDVSGSMSGTKIQLVKKSMVYLLELLGENDRLCIITFQSFAERVCPLLKNNLKNRSVLEKAIENLSARGGTNINAGMELAFRVLEEKKYKNNVQSIFLLSDGIDGGAQKRVQQNINTRIDLMKKSAFSVHTFGYGSDHDPKLMKQIANLRDGNFFFIEKYQTLDQAFASSLGGLFSVVAQEIDLTVKCLAKGIYSDIKISKAFGDISIYNKLKDEYNIHYSQFLSGISKNLIFQLSVPPINQKIGDNERNQTLLQVKAMVKPLGGEKVEIVSTLVVTFLNEDEQLKQMEADPEVVQNYTRVKAVQIMKQNIKLMQSKKFDEVQKNILIIQKDMESKNYLKSQKIQNLKMDIKKMKGQIQQKDFIGAQRFFEQAERAHSREKNYNYQNDMQTKMVEEVRTKKKR